MKVDEFIEDMEALCIQYWGSEWLTYRFKKADPKICEEDNEDGIVILFDDNELKTK